MSRTARYERVADPLLAALGLVFLVSYAWPILQPGLPHLAAEVCARAGTMIWAIMAADYAVRLVGAQRRLQFLRRTWLDLLMVLLPMLRPLRAVRGLLALRVMGRGGARTTRRTVVGSVVAMVAAGGAVAALAMLDAERGAPGATITGYGDALWWAISTITTVGYGDRYPVTMEGRMVAAALMVSGIALLGVVTASLASWFVERVGEMTSGEQRAQASIDALLDEVRALRAEVRQMRPSGLSDVEPSGT
jgi:voltage-gated potassium channel